MKSREYFNVYAVVDKADYFGVFRDPLVGVAELKSQGEIIVSLNALPLSGKFILRPREENEFERTTREMMEGKDK